MNRRVKRLCLELWLPVLALLAWWFGSANSTSIFFPSLRDIATDTKRLWLFDHLWSDLVPSLVNLVYGYALAVVIGVAAGLLLGSLPRLLDAVEPELEFLRAVPAVALLPVAVIVLGLGDGMRVSMIAFGAVWPVLINTLAAVSGIDSVQRDVQQAFGLSLPTRVLRVRLGAAIPQIVAGARVSLSVAVVLIVVSEMQGADRGIGNFLLNAERSFALTDMWTGMVVLGVVGYLLNLLFRRLERVLLRHYPPARSGPSSVEAR
ncbi:MAG: transporter permease [Mycobacterium sp.]|nr:transporter permease [Mycobacterium sp.]